MLLIHSVHTLSHTYYCLAISKTAISNSFLWFRKCKPLSRVNIPRLPIKLRVVHQRNTRMRVELESGSSEGLRLEMKRISSRLYYQGKMMSIGEFCAVPMSKDRNISEVSCQFSESHPFWKWKSWWFYGVMLYRDSTTFMKMLGSP